MSVIILQNNLEHEIYLLNIAKHAEICNSGSLTDIYLLPFRFICSVFGFRHVNFELLLKQDHMTEISTNQKIEVRYKSLNNV